MTWSSALGVPEWRAWILGVSSSSQVRVGLRLDPFGTSWRSLSGQARRWLPKIRDGQSFADTEHRTRQALTDLGAANLVTASAALTPFGEAVIKRWESIPASWEFELPLAVVLLQEAIAAEEMTFIEMMAFWWDIRSRFGDEESVLADKEAVILLPYLNQSVNDFNAWIALREYPGSLTLPVPWSDLAAAAGGDAAVSAALSKLQGVLDPSRRLKPSVVFCRAMSLLFLRKEHSESVEPCLAGLKLPVRTERS